MNFILGSWAKLALASVFWVLLFAVLYQSAAAWQVASRTGAGELFEHLHLNYFDWTVQSAATFVGLQQSLSGDVGGDDLIKEIERLCGLTHEPLISRPSAQSHQTATIDPDVARDATSRLRTLRPLMRWWWSLYVLEMLMGYLHAGGLIYMILQKFGRK